MDFNDVTALASLIDDALEAAEEAAPPISSPLGTGHAGPAAGNTQPKSDGPARVSRDIWDDDEVLDSTHRPISTDPRPAPRYTASFVTELSSAELYGSFQMLSSATDEASGYRVVIDLPHVIPAKIDTSVDNGKLRLYTPAHRLELTLPRPVIDRDVRAKWNQKTEQLTVELPFRPS
jgi:hypothetical protein